MRRPAGSWLEEVHSSLRTLQHMCNTARASVSHRIHCVGLVLHLGCILHGLELLEQMYFLFKCLCRGSRVRWANGEDGSPVVNFWFPSGSLLVRLWFPSSFPTMAPESDGPTRTMSPPTFCTVASNCGPRCGRPSCNICSSNSRKLITHCAPETVRRADR